MPPLNLLVKPSSGQCNLRCRYCFYCDLTEKREQSSYGFMTEETLDNMMREAFAFAEQDITIAYQGGEPTLRGLDFFRRSIELQEKYNVHHIPVHNSLQTNGSLLNEEWADFFREHHFLIGVSLDGTKETNDAFRLDKSGKSSYPAVMKNIQMLAAKGVEFNILTVVHSRTARTIGKIYGFFRKNHLDYLQFIPCLDPLGEEPGGHDFSLTPKAYGEFLCRLFDCWYQDLRRGEAVSIRQFDNYVQMLLGYPPESCGMSGVCSFQNVVEADGSVYPCDFYVTDPYRLGNLNENSFEEIYKKRGEIRFIEESMDTDEECRGCQWLPLCGNGCKRYREPKRPDGTYQRNFFCQAYRMFFEYSYSRLREIAAATARMHGIPGPR